MPITSSAKKAHRGSKRKREQNDARRDAMRDTMKAIKKLLAQGKTAEARTQLAAAYRAIDKAMKRGLLKKNTAARKKSGLSKLVRRAVK